MIRQRRCFERCHEKKPGLKNVEVKAPELVHVLDYAPNFLDNFNAVDTRKLQVEKHYTHGSNFLESVHHATSSDIYDFDCFFDGLRTIVAKVDVFVGINVLSL